MKSTFLIAAFASALAFDAVVVAAETNDPPVKPKVKVVTSKATGKKVRVVQPEDPAAPAAVPALPGAADAGKKGTAAKGGAGKSKGKEKEKDKEADPEAQAAAAEAAVKEADNDNIEMISGDLIYGKIHKELPDSVIILMRDDQARVKVPRERIKALNYSMQTRLNSLEKDDMEGRYKVGLWAMGRNMYPEAIELFEFLKKQTLDNKKDGAGPDLLKQLAIAYDKREQFDKAFVNYKEYLLGHNDDAEALEAYKRIELLVKPKEVAAAEAPKIVDGLEADGKWQAETWPNANACAVGITADTLGNKMVAVTSDGGTQAKIAFSRYGQPLMLSESSEMVFKVFNDSNNPVNLACAFINAEGDFHETHFIRIMPKAWSKESVKIDTKTFKSNRNDFKEYNQEIKGREHVARLTFMIYDQRPVKLFLDSLFFK